MPFGHDLVDSFDHLVSSDRIVQIVSVIRCQKKKREEKRNTSYGIQSEQCSYAKTHAYTCLHRRSGRVSEFIFVPSRIVCRIGSQPSAQQIPTHFPCFSHRVFFFVPRFFILFLVQNWIQYNNTKIHYLQEKKHLKKKRSKRIVVNTMWSNESAACVWLCVYAILQTYTTYDSTSI